MRIYDNIMDGDEYVRQETEKKAIFLHHTAGGCFTYDTKVKTLSGTSVDIGSIKRGQSVWVYGCEENGRVVPVEAIGLGKTKDVTELTKITLDNGEVIECTPDHRFMLRDGSYLPAGELVEGQSLMPLYTRDDNRGYEEIKHNDDGSWQKTHQLVGKSVYGEHIYKTGGSRKNVLHHVDFDKRNNSPDNLQLMDMEEHILLHSELMKENWQDERWVEKMKEVSSRNMKNLKEQQSNDPEYKKFLSETMKRRWKDGEFDYQRGSTLTDEHKSKVSASLKKKFEDDIEWATKQKNAASKRGSEYWTRQWSDPEKRKEMVERNRINAKRAGRVTAKRNKEMWKDPNHRAKVSKSVAERNVLYGQYKRSEHYKVISYQEWKSTHNHKVVKVETIQLETPVPVYDIEVPRTSNFALESGIFVHNSRGDWTINTWNNDSRGKIATAFVVSGQQILNNGTTGDISHDGRIWRAFPEENWSYHIGKGLTAATKYSVGIEICNYGYLYKGNDGRFYNYVNKPIPFDQVVQLPQPFRGHQYWHRYTDAQIESTKYLIYMLSDKFKIDYSKGLLEYLQAGEGYDAFEFKKESTTPSEGIWSHTNARRDKTDVSPQPHLIEMLMTL